MIGADRVRPNETSQKIEVAWFTTITVGPFQQELQLQLPELRPGVDQARIHQRTIAETTFSQ